jgi:hypothetical protein
VREKIVVHGARGLEARLSKSKFNGDWPSQNLFGKFLDHQRPPNSKATTFTQLILWQVPFIVDGKDNLLTRNYSNWPCETQNEGPQSKAFTGLPNSSSPLGVAKYKSTTPMVQNHRLNSTRRDNDSDPTYPASRYQSQVSNTQA